MASPGCRFREMKRTNHMHEFAKVCVQPHQTAPLPILCPHQVQSERWGSGSVLPAIRGMGDWILASPRLPGFDKPELAVSQGAPE